MKTLLLTAFLSISTLSLMAQQETLFNKARVIGAFGAPIVEYGKINDDTRASIGIGGGIVIDEFFIGGYGLGSADFESWIDNDNPVLELGHGGLWLGYSHKPYNLAHLYSSLKIGWGAVDIALDDPDFDIFDEHDWDGIFVLTPEIGLEINVTRWFHIAATAGYRWIDGVDSPDFTNNDFRGPVGGVTFRFGWFGRWRHDED